MRIEKGTGTTAGILLIGVFLLCMPVGSNTQQGGKAEDNPQEKVLYANLYMQTSAEYRALCMQIYGWAGERLRQRLAALPAGGLPPAVVMDLDEAVFDNAGFQSFMDREKLSEFMPHWETWERDMAAEVRIIHGAKGFIDLAESHGVSVIYISNRLTKYRDGTVAALRNIGLSTANIDARLLLKGETSDKSARRRTVQERHNVLMYVGDNLRDFAEEFAVGKISADDSAAQMRAIEERFARVDRAAYHFGNDWIVLPNPAYGEWVYPLGSNPRSKLRSTKMEKVPAGGK